MEFTVFIFTLLFFVAIINPVSKGIHDELMKKYQNENLVKVPEEMIEGQYELINLEDGFGKEISFYIVDEDSKIVYYKDFWEKPELTSEEIALIPYEDKKPIVNRVEGIELDKKKQVYVNLYYYRDVINIASEYYILDKKLNIIETDVDSERKSFTEKELELAFGNYLNQFFVSKLEFKNSSGQNYTAIFFRDYNLSGEIGSSKNGNKIINMILLIILFTFATVIYLLSLYKNVKKPFIIINEAIDKFAEGSRCEIVDYKGTKEFEMVCKNFNNMALKVDELEKRKINSEEINRKIIADISHDLKTPITVIQGYMKAFLDGKINKEKSEEYYMRVYKKAGSMTELVNALSEYSKINRPDFKLNLLYDNLSAFAREYFVDKYNELEIFNYEIEVKIPDKDMYCTYDEFHMTRVFDNIIANTLKHTDEGTCIFFDLAEEKDNIQIRIGDNGPGILKENQKHLFEPFMTADPARTDGTGLGMSIVKMIIDYHKGTIDIIKNRSNDFMYEIKLPKEL